MNLILRDFRRVSVLCRVLGCTALLLLGPSNAAVRSAAAAAAAQSKPVELSVPGAPIPIRVLVQSPAETQTDLQIVCLFRSAPENTLHGSLVELNEKLHGLLDKIRTPALFRGDLGETIVLTSPPATLGAKRLLIIGLGDSQTFTPERMELVGSIAYRESFRLGSANPYFAPTILDGGVTKFATGEVAPEFLHGFLRAIRSHDVLLANGAAPPKIIASLTFLAGPTHAADTQQGLARALGGAQ
jgi:cytosol aminopeptidase family protein